MLHTSKFTIKDKVGLMDMWMRDHVYKGFQGPGGGVTGNMGVLCKISIWN